MKNNYIYSSIALSAVISSFSFAGAPIPAAPPPARHNVNEILGDANDFKPGTRRGAGARITAAREALVEPMVARLMLQAVVRHWAADTDFGTQARALLNQMNPPAPQVAEVPAPLPAPAPAPAMPRVRSTQVDLERLDEQADAVQLQDLLQLPDLATTGETHVVAVAPSGNPPQALANDHVLTETGARARLDLAFRFLDRPQGLDVFDIGIDLQIIAACNGADTLLGAQARLLLIEFRRRGVFETHTTILREYLAAVEAHARLLIPQEQIVQAGRTLELLVERDRLYEETRQMVEAEAERMEREAYRAMQQEAEAPQKRAKNEEADPANNNAVDDDVQFVFGHDYLDFADEEEPIVAPVFPPILPVEPEAPTVNFLQGPNVQALVANTLAAIASVTPVAYRVAKEKTRRRK